MYIDKDQVRLSVVLPVYNKQNSITVIAGLLKRIIEKDLNIKRYEVIYVDDCSTDNSLQILQQMKDEHVVVIKHAKNMGQVRAIETGLKAATGNLFAVYSCDMQNSFETIIPLFNAIAEGNDLAAGYRATRSDTGLGVLFSKAFFGLLSLFEPKMPRGGFDFCLMNNYLYQQLIKNDFDKVFLQLEVLHLSRKTYFLPSERINDTFDKSSWTFISRVKYAHKSLKYIIKRKLC